MVPMSHVPLAIRIAAATGGTPELVDDDVTGCLFDPQKPEALAADLLSLCKDPARLDAMRVAALERGRKSFVPERFFQESEQCYRELLGLP